MGDDFPDHLELARDALHSRRITRIQCFQSNAAAFELEQIGASALDAIEYVLANEAKLTPPDRVDGNGGYHYKDSAAAAMLGAIGNLLVSYIEIVDKCRMNQRAVLLFEALPDDLRQEALRCYLFLAITAKRVALSLEILDLCQRIAAGKINSGEQTRDLARRILRGTAGGKVAGESRDPDAGLDLSGNDDRREAPYSD